MIDQDAIGMKTADIGSGSSLLAHSTDPLAIGETRQIGPVWTRNINTIGIDIVADRACTLQVVRLPDGVNPGEASAAVDVAAGVPAYHTYSEVMCLAVRLVVVNTSGAAMATFALTARGAA